MSDSTKKHYFLFTAHFSDKNRGHDLFQEDTGTFNLPYRNIPKKILTELGLKFEESMKISHPNIDPVNYRIIALSYLGEMTTEEFDS